ncbi:MAG TPA: hypothetical protein VJ652_15185 [Noviherbaspirillum sp.]|nr:hypothetical protein [Noviherbaspirillum sp.]
MRTVLYTDDMEPITVLELTGFAENYLDFHGEVTLPVIPPPSTMAREMTPTELSFKTVRIRAERFIRNGERHMLLFTADEESALLLEAAFLPGQRRALQDSERRAFARGFLDALARLG